MVTSKNKFKILMHFHYLFIVLPYTKMNQIDRSRVFWSSTALENIGESLRYSDWFLSFVCFYYIHSVFFCKRVIWKLHSRSVNVAFASLSVTMMSIWRHDHAHGLDQKSHSIRGIRSRSRFQNAITMKFWLKRVL